MYWLQNNENTHLLVMVGGTILKVGARAADLNF